MSLVDWIMSRFTTYSSGFCFEVGKLTACGLVRKENQDSVLALSEAGLFCVADGMGGGKGGALASRWICDGFANAARAEEFDSLSGDDRMLMVDRVLKSVNHRIRAYAAEKGYRSMGSTVAMMVFNPQDGAHPSIVHVGDSRVYRLRRGELRLMTSDHTVGGEMSRKTVSRTESENLSSRRNPLSHILTRAVGTEFRVRPDWQKAEVRAGDRYLLCTDGVHDMLSDADILAAMKGRVGPEVIVTRLEKGIVAAGASDNYSMICIEVRRRRR